LYEVVLPTDRWSARIVSPVDIRDGLKSDHDGVVVVHPGWGKAPERNWTLLERLAREGFLPLGVDTRYGYADRRLPRRGVTSQPYVVGARNPYFELMHASDNRWRYRRPTVLLDICERLGIGKRSYVGHSEGGRITALAATANPDITNKLIVINGAGTGSSAKGAARLVRSNANRISELARTRNELVEATVSALGSTAYALSHLRRTNRERHEIQATDTWKILDELAQTPVDVTVLHARQDEMISFSDSALRANERNWVDFVPTDGGHSNVYDTAIHSLVIDALKK